MQIDLPLFTVSEATLFGQTVQKGQMLKASCMMFGVVFIIYVGIHCGLVVPSLICRPGLQTQRVPKF